MAQLNTTNKPTKFTHEGAPAKNITHMQQLRRSVLSCMLFEDTFYEDGQDIASLIQQQILNVRPEDVCKLAIEARTKFKLRHVPLWILTALAAGDYPIGDTLAEVIQRPDEITEFLAMYQKDGRHPIANQIKKGLAKAFKKFDEYQLQKYNRAKKFTLKFAMKLVHPKPDNPEQSALWKRLLKDELATPQTWEVILSDKTDCLSKKEKWEKIIDLWITDDIQ
jgi:hypothetical protein